MNVVNLMGQCYIPVLSLRLSLLQTMYLIVWQQCTTFKITIIFIILDIDECSMGLSGCSQLCVNTIGSYVCGCYPGYQLSSDNQTCASKSYLMINFCSELSFAS